MLSKALNTRPVSLRTNPVVVLVAAVPACASVVGAALVVNQRLGMALLLGLLFLPVVLLNLQLALVLWFPLVFLEGLPAYNMAAKAGGLLIVAAWVAATASPLRSQIQDVLRRHRALMLAVAMLLLWYSLTLVWAPDTAHGLADLWHWYAVALLMLVVATTLSTTRHLRMMCAAFVVGAVLTVGHGIVTGGLTTSTTAVHTAGEGRLSGGQGDPNFLAAGIVPAIILAIALFPTTRRRTLQWAAVGAVGILALGLVASESRGGVIAALLATVTGFALFKRQRAYLVAFVAVVAGIAAAWFSVSPRAWARISDFDNGGSGRSDLWTLAWRMFEANPIGGVGINHYSALAPDYVRESGSLERLDLVFDDTAQVAHNAYLQVLAETGLIGLGLFLMVAVLSMRAAWIAGARAEASGDRVLESLARGTVVAMIGLLGSSFFITNGVDKRLWVLFALGPAFNAAASRRADSYPGLSAAAQPHHPDGRQPAVEPPARARGAGPSEARAENQLSVGR